MSEKHSAVMYLSLNAGFGAMHYLTDTFAIEFIDGLAILDLNSVPEEVDIDELKKTIENDNQITIITKEQYNVSYAVRTGNESVELGPESNTKLLEENQRLKDEIARMRAESEVDGDTSDTSDSSDTSSDDGETPIKGRFS